MGNNKSTAMRSQPPEIKFSSSNKCNYNCPVCKNTNKTPNLAGRFFIINEKECQCNACNAIFPRERFYKPVIENVECC